MISPAETSAKLFENGSFFSVFQFHNKKTAHWRLGRFTKIQPWILISGLYFYKTPLKHGALYNKTCFRNIILPLTFHICPVRHNNHKELAILDQWSTRNSDQLLHTFDKSKGTLVNLERTSKLRQRPTTLDQSSVLPTCWTHRPKPNT